MWDVLSGDFDRDINPAQCYSNVIDNARSGSIIVFHDSVKAEENLRQTLPQVLDFYAHQGYQFMPLTASAMRSKQQPLLQQLA